jgi:SAM-dependent methyltransferase
MKTINTCEVCGNKTLTPVLDLGLHPLCDDLVPINDDRLCEEYPIDILFCEKCYTAHQHYQVEKQSLFSKNYHYRARMTPSVLEGMKDLVNSCEKQFGNLTGKTVLDIGCNDGSLLNYFKEKGCNTIGVEPTGAAADSVHYTINDFFDKDAVDKILLKYNSIDIITFTNVFAHIEDLNGLIANLNKLINKNTKVVIENHYIGAVLKTGQFDTFYHEHPRTYSFESFKFVAEKLNLNIVGVEFVTRYGGNIRVFMGQEIKSEVSVDETSFLSLFSTIRMDLEKWKKEEKQFIENFVAKNGKIRAKAFPGRAAIMIKLLDLNESHISAVYEIKGSIKVGHYVPGTRIPILPEKELYLLEDQTLPILNLAWHIPKEVRANLEKNGYKGDVIDIKSFI